MSRVKSTAIIFVILAFAALGALRVAQIISAREEETKRDRMSHVPVVDVASVSQGLVEEKIHRTGNIVPETQVTIYSKVQGWVDKINVREGDRVKTGQVLAILDAREAEAAVAQAKASLDAATARLKQVKATSEEAVQSQIQNAKANMEFAELDLRRAQELHQDGFIARQQLDEARMKYTVAKAAYDLALNSIRQKTWENDIALAEAQLGQAKANLDLSRAQLANLTILSPMNGGVTKRYIDPGTMVKDDAPIMTLMDLSEVKMVVNVIERDFVRLQIGQPVKITVTAFPSKTFQGRISVIIPALEMQSRTAEIQISIPNPEYVLNPGMFGGAEILLRSNPKATLVPIQALFTMGGKDIVYVIKDNKAFARTIRKGLIKDTFVEIIEGVNAGEKVVTAGQDSLEEGSIVRLKSDSVKQMAN
jgi:multidrug efflux pump subunit AcrA (membrane-fusion protein)